MIHLVFADRQRMDAENILYFLTKEKQLAIYSQSDGSIALQSDKRIARDSAIVLVSNAAVEDENWQMLVAGIPEHVRIIPISCSLDTESVNHAQVPEKVKEINYIKRDGKQHENIWESLTLEDEFYAIKNMLLLNLNAWVFSKYSEDFLLTDRKSIKKYLLMFQKKQQTETDPHFRGELTGLLEFLKLSMRHARSLLMTKIVDFVKIVVAVSIAATCLVMFLRWKNLTERMSYTNVVVGAGTYEEIASTTAIRFVDGIMNPLISVDIKSELYNTLSDHLNMNWHNTPVGPFYKWTLNDAQLAADERYLWSANGNGNIAKWDTYTGQIVEQENVSSKPLLAMAASEKEDLFIALDFDGYLFKKHNGGPWERSAEPYNISASVDTKLRCSGEMVHAILRDASGKLLWFDLQAGFDLIWEGQADKIFCTELTGNGLEAVVRKGDDLYDLLIRADGTADEIRIPIEPDSACSMDIRNGIVVMSDSHFQIVTWIRSASQTWSPSGIVLSRPLYLCFLNEQVIVYNDRNTGTHLYDLKRRLDLGRILANAAVISSLSAFSNTVMAGSNGGVYNTENVEFLLPLDQLDRDGVSAVYTMENMSSAGRIQQASIENENSFQVDIRLEDGSTVSRQMDRLMNLFGKTTAAGIGHDGEVLLVGCLDGSFFEITFSETGGFQYVVRRQIPSHAAIKSISQTADCYYLEDVTGTFWRMRIGYDALTPDGAVKAVKEKLHCAVTEDVKEVVGKETLKALDVSIMPGGGVREWE